MITISKETAAELIAALNSLSDHKGLETPTHSLDGEEIKSIESLAETMGVPTVIAAYAVMEQKDHPLANEVKVRNVRDAAYWGLPLGTPILPGMKPHPVNSASRASRAAIRRNRAASALGPRKRILERPRRRLWRLTPRGHFNNIPGNANGGGGGAGGGGGGGGLGGIGGGLGALGKIAGLSLSNSPVPKGARKIGQVAGEFSDGSRGKAARYVTKLQGGENVTWLLLGRYTANGKLIKEQTAKIKRGEADKAWKAVITALKPRGS